MYINNSFQNALIHDFYKSHNTWVYNWLRKKLGCAYDAADLTQDTFLRVLLKQDPVSIIEPRAYLTKIAHGLMVNFIRRRDLEKSYLVALELTADIFQPSPEVRAIAFETLVKIDEMLDGLPYKVRQAFLLLQFEGLSHADIAAQLNVSISSVRQYIAKALLHCLSIHKE